MDTNDTPAPESAQPIRTADINQLLQSPSTADTMSHVAAVIRTLICLDPVTDDLTSVDHKFGMYLIHTWLANTLRFAAKHPSVEAVVPATSAPGGAS